MTAHTFDTTTLPDSQFPGNAMVVPTHLTITINLGSRAEATGAHDTAQIDDLISDADEFTSVPSATAAVPVIGDPGPPAVQANGTGNGHTILVG